MYAIHLLLNGKKGISGLQLQREIGGGYKTSWRILNRIRVAMKQEGSEFMGCIIEIDETYVGGKPRKNGTGKNIDKNVKRGRGTNKIPVIGVIDRMYKEVYARVALPNKESKKLTGKQLMEVLDTVVKTPSSILTDEFRSYNILKSTKHMHFKIDHSKEYVDKNDPNLHTNNIESFWATLKRGVYGIYHHISAKYLQNYVDEFCFRYNNRLNPEVFNLVLQNSVLT